MKRLALILTLLVFTIINSQGQISLEYTFPDVSASYINLPIEGYKFYVMDVVNSQCRLYNPDHSLWKTINLSVQSGYYLYDIQCVSEHLFNNDNAIELLYVSYQYNATTSSYYYNYDTRIADETGNVLLDVPLGSYTDIYKTSSGSKMLIWVTDYSVYPSTVHTNVYTIPGQIVTDSPQTPGSGLGSLKRAYPNPAMNNVTIPFSLPEDVRQAELKIYDMNGNVVRLFAIDHTFDNIKMPIGDLPSGTYLYSLETDKYKSESYKLVISR